MKALIVFYSKTGSTRKVAETFARVFASKGWQVETEEIVPLTEMRAHQYKKDVKNLKLAEPSHNPSNFDLVIAGTPVWDYCPCPIVTAYLRQVENVNGKKFVLFATCMALPGTTIKRLANILATKGAVIVDSLTVKSIFELDALKLKKASEFAEKVADNFAK